MAKKLKRLSAEELEQIRDLYVQGEDSPDGRRYPTLVELADRFGSSIATISRKAKENGWEEQRSVFEAKLHKDRDELRRKEMINQSVEFDSNSLLLAKSLQAEIGKVLQSVAQRRRSDPQGEHLIGASSLTQLANALSICHRTGRLALGESTENTNVSGSIKANEALDEAFSIVEQLARTRSGGTKELH